MDTRLSSIFVVCIAVIGASCKDSPSMPSTTTPTTTATTTPPVPTTPANAEISLTGTFECVDPFCDFAAFDLTLRNTGGVGANLNFIRIENRDMVPILELGADHFINAFGNNRLEAGATMDFVLNGQLGFVVIVGYRDDNGNRGEARYFPDLPR